MNCTCDHLDKHRNLIVFEYHGSEAQPYINDKGKQYIHDFAGEYGHDMIYLLCEEMHFRCMIENRNLVHPLPGVYISRFCLCKLHNICKLSVPIDYSVYKSVGILANGFSEIQIPNFKGE